MIPGGKFMLVYRLEITGTRLVDIRGKSKKIRRIYQVNWNFGNWTNAG